jgi:hypothetical protein
MRIFIILAILMLILCGCAIQTPPTQLSTARTSIPTSNVTYTASPTPLLSPTSEETEVVLTVTSVMLPKEAFHFGATPQMRAALMVFITLKMRQTKHVLRITEFFVSMMMALSCLWQYVMMILREIS